MKTKFPKLTPTEAALTIIRVAALLALGMVVMIGILGEPYDTDSDLVWMLKFWASKGVAAIAGYAFYRLGSRWVKTDEWIAAYNAREEEQFEKEDNWL